MLPNLPYEMPGTDATLACNERLRTCNTTGINYGADLERRQGRRCRLPIESHTTNLQTVHHAVESTCKQAQGMALTTGSCTLEKCSTGVGFRPVMPWLYAPRAILSSATSTNITT